MFKITKIGVTWCLGILFMTFTQAQIPIDSISFEYFEKERIKEIAFLHLQVKKNNNPWSKVNLAKNYSFINREDSAVKYFTSALKDFELKNDKKSMRAILPEIITNISAQNYSQNNAHAYRNKLIELSQDLPQFNKYNVFLYKSDAIDSIVNKNYPEALNILTQLKTHFAPNDSIAMYAAILSNIAYCKQHITPEQFDSAQIYYSSAINLSKANNLYNLLFNDFINLSNLYRRKKNYSLALQYLDSASYNPPKNWKLKSYRILYNNYHKIYKQLGDYENALHYLEASNKITTITNEIAQNQIIEQINAQYELERHTTQLSVYQKLLDNYRRNKWYYLVGLLLTFLLALYSFVRWKKEDRRRFLAEKAKQDAETAKERAEKQRLVETKKRELSEVQKQKIEKEKQALEVKQKETEQEVEKLNKLVLKKHIILKNKSKVNIDDILYIKSDGHYLELHTTYGKEFVRGKLSQILAELPPNFIQVHRSYIVNYNYIQAKNGNSIYLTDKTEIPLSRNYKKTLDHFKPKKDNDTE